MSKCKWLPDTLSLSMLVQLPQAQTYVSLTYNLHFCSQVNIGKARFTTFFIPTFLVFENQKKWKKQARAEIKKRPSLLFSTFFLDRRFRWPFFGPLTPLPIWPSCLKHYFSRIEPRTDGFKKWTCCKNYRWTKLFWLGLFFCSSLYYSVAQPCDENL